MTALETTDMLSTIPRTQTLAVAIMQNAFKCVFLFQPHELDSAEIPAAYLGWLNIHNRSRRLAAEGAAAL